MIQLSNGGIYLVHGKNLIPENEVKKVESILGRKVDKEEAHKGTIAYRILEKHNQSSDMKHLKIKFDALTSHDITYVGIIQTAKASGMDKFPMPYILTCCHNSLCAVGGTINEDDHMFGLSAAKKYGGIYVPPHVAVIHQYMREMYAGCGKMILAALGGELKKEFTKEYQNKVFAQLLLVSGINLVVLLICAFIFYGPIAQLICPM